MSYTYRVLADAFIGGVLRKPGDDRHGVFTSEKKIEPLPDHLEEVKPETEEVATERKAAADKLQKSVKKQREEVKGASFMNDPNPSASKTGGVETL